MGSLDQPTGSTVKRKIKFVDVTSYNPTQLENAFNNNYGIEGWRIVQIVIIGSSRYILAEKEY